MSTKKKTVLLVGMGGYGNTYLQAILNDFSADEIELAGAVDPFPDGCRYLQDLKERRVPIFAGIGQCLSSRQADLVIVTTPVHLHATPTCAALTAGSSVLCEKPLASTLQDAREMKAAAERVTGFAAVGYQWSFSEPMQALKSDILAGRLGRPLRLKSLVCWPRPESYYTRNNWAGRIALADGTRVLDSPATNAAAHFLHNMIYILGDTPQASASLREVSPEPYRVNDIENYDTVALRCRTADGVDIFFYATHAAQREVGPLLEYQFEEGVVRMAEEEGNRLVATWRDGRVRDYGHVFDSYHGLIGKLRHCLAALDGGPPPSCTIDSALSHVICVNGAQRQSEEIPTIPEVFIERIAKPDGTLRAVRGLESALLDCYDRWMLPGELKHYPWAHPAWTVSLNA